MKFSVQELRPEVLGFALLMEARLRDKDADKGQSWKNMTARDLLVQAGTKGLQCEDALRKGRQHVSHAVDLANYAMMIADVAGALETGEANGGEGWAGLDQVQMP
jgi:hypothetical protein